MIADIRLLKPKDVADILGVSRGQVLCLINANRLRAVNVSTSDKVKRWRVDPRWIEEFKIERVNLADEDRAYRRRRRKARRKKKKITSNHTGFFPENNQV